MIDYCLKPATDFLKFKRIAWYTGFTTLYSIEISDASIADFTSPFYQPHYFLGEIPLPHLRGLSKIYTSRLVGYLRQSDGRNCPAFVDMTYAAPLGGIFGVIAMVFVSGASGIGLPEHTKMHFRPSTGNIKIGGGENYSVNQCLEPSHCIEDTKSKSPKAHGTRQEFEYHRYIREKHTRRLHYTQSEASHSSPLSGEFSSLQENGQGLWGRKKLVAWKKSFGRSKEWRCCRYLKATKQQTKGISFAGREQRAQISWNPFLPKVPIGALRRNVGFKLRSYTRSRKFFRSSDAAPSPYLTEEVLWNDFDSDAEDNETKHSSEASKPTPPIPTDSLTTQPGSTKPIFSNLSIPYENFVGAILGSTFRMLGILRSESHGDVYAVGDLSPSPDRYEAKSYILHGIPQKLYKYRVRNLKKLAAKPLFICSLDQNGRKFVINRLDKKVEGTSKASKDSKLGAIGRRNTPEFDEAFPELPKPSHTRMGESSANCTTTDSLLATIQPRLKKEARALLPPGVPKPATLTTRNYAPVLRSNLRNGEGKFSNSNTTTALGTSDQKEGGRGKKPKTPQQIERNRVRQCQSRKKKRAQRKVDSVEEDFSLNSDPYIDIRCVLWGGYASDRVSYI
ncbi:hypothetical protein FGG08_002749 [Glutinoglossum americanum]|uniref:Uncharacterized protein n=1 Tax=Glutinoglossum americanum TaxID=1670608 RepID=A0A9P8L5C0_9PEZI|nr:hypothetical protein FGG08_002749 [Glutinoglossum americanum]